MMITLSDLSLGSVRGIARFARRPFKSYGFSNAYAAGVQSRGDDIVGLNRAFIYAGAATVVASLWTVDDQATSQLMRSFYTLLRRGVGKAEALRQAQSETRRRYPNPYYWTAFVLNGEPGLSRALAPAIPNSGRVPNHSQGVHQIQRRTELNPINRQGA